jgi:hypothetical protein
MDGHPTAAHRVFRPLSAAVATGLVATALAACGSSSTMTAGSAAVPIEAPCVQVASVLSNGPDADADPVGYAQAQVLQLRQLTISHEPLHRAVAAMASAYQQFSESKGGAAAEAAVNKASDELNAICPGATS